MTYLSLSLSKFSSFTPHTYSKNTQELEDGI